MTLAQFEKAVDIAQQYFVLQGLDDERTASSVRRHVSALCVEGETRPLMLANLAIERTLKQLDAELEIQSEELYVLFNKA